MMFEPDRNGVPRAYVTADVAADDAIGLAADWGWNLNTGQRLGILIPHRTAIEENSGLAQLDRSGEGVFATWRYSAANAKTSGPQIAYYPDLEHLLEVERRMPAGIVLVGADETHRSWVTAYSPTLLAGKSIADVEPAIDPVVAVAVATFTDSVNSSTGLVDRRDRSKVTDGLQRLLRHGYAFTPEQLIAAALSANWQGRAAFALGALADDVLRGVRKQIRERYADGIVERWQAAASERGREDQL